MAHFNNSIIRHYSSCYIMCYLLLSAITAILCSRTPINTQDQARFFNNFITPAAKSNHIKANEVSPYVDLALCTIRQEPWSCARQQSARILEAWDGELYSEWQTLKVEADRELNTTLAKRGFSGSENLSKEKPSTILKKIELGTNYMKEYLTKTMDGFLGYEYVNSEKSNDGDEDDAEEEEAEEDPKDDEYENEEAGDTNNAEENESEPDIVTNAMKPTAIIDTKNDVISTSEDLEFIELNQTETVKNDAEDGTERKKDRKRKKNKKGQEQPGTVVIVQQPASSSAHHGLQHGHGGAGTEDIYHEEPSKPFNKKKHRKQKRRKNKHQHQLAQSDDDALSSALLGHNPTSSLGLGLLEDLLEDDDWLDGGKRKKGHSANYGRSNGVTRGKKKKKKKALMKLVLLGSFLKAKIELLLKILGAHLQIKFFAIALIGLLINIARFWIDVKRGSSPQKVIYVENAHHQHHYEDHGEEWTEPGGYWKRSLPSAATPDDNGSTDSYQPQNDAQYMAYRNQWQ